MPNNKIEMTDLIDREKVMHEIDQLSHAWEYGNAVDDCYEIVKKAPAVEAIPVRCGKWIKYAQADFPYPYHSDDYVCSVCSTVWATKEIRNMKHCPSCGSKMIEVKE